MMAGRITARALTTTLLVVGMLVALAAGPAALAAAAPNLTIEQPLNGSVSANDLPLFSGSSEAEGEAVTVKVYEGPSAEGLPVAVLTSTSPLPEGKWEVTAEAPLEPGVYTAVAEQELEGAVSAPVTFTIESVDTTAPTVSIEPVASPTSDATPTLTGGAGTEPGDGTVTVTIYEGLTTENEVVSGSATTEGSTWKYTPTELPDGTYTAQATQQDEAGHTGASTAVTFTVDTTAPTVSIEPVASPTSDATPTLTGGAGIEPGDGAVTVTIYEGPAAKGNIASTGKASTEGSTWEYTPTELPDGTYTAQAFQDDEAGNTTSSTAVTFTVDTIPPAVSIDPVATPTKDATPTLTGGAGTEPGDGAITVTVYEGPAAEGKIASTGKATSEGSTWKYTPAELPDGVYTAQATQHDAAGHTATSTAVTFTVDATAPEVSIDPVTSPTNDATPTLTGSAGTEPGDGTITVTVYEGPAAKGNVASTGSATSEGSTWKYTPAKLSDGIYTAKAVQHDQAGNTGASLATTFTVDATAPHPTITAPTEGAVLNTSRVTLSGTASQSSGDLNPITLKIYASASTAGGPVQTLEVTANAGKWTTGASGPILADHLYTVLAEQSDQAGNVGTDTVTFTIKTNSPTVTLNTDTVVPRESLFVTNATPSFSGTGSTAPEDSSTILVSVYKGQAASGSPVMKIETTLSGSKWQTGPVTALADGAYTAIAEQETTNPLKPQTGVSATSKFTVDGHAPAVTLTTPTNDTATTSSSPPLAGAAGTAAGDSTAVTVKLYTGSSATGTPLQAVTVQATAGTWSTAAGGLEPGTYTARAEQADDVGNVGLSVPATFTVAAPEPAPVTKTETTPATPPVTTPIAPPVAPPATTEPTLMQPFPVVRIAGSVSSFGVKLNLLTVQAPLDASVTVSCHGHGCPAKRVDTVSTSGRSGSKLGLVTITFRRFERSLSAGASLQIRVSKAGQIGKYTRFTIRRGKLPKRLDTCLSATGTQPVTCPS